MGDVARREAVHVWGQGSTWEISVTSPQVCCKHETALKKQSLNKHKQCVSSKVHVRREDLKDKSRDGLSILRFDP